MMYYERFNIVSDLGDNVSEKNPRAGIFRDSHPKPQNDH
jgi:hypothetical protein